MIFIPRQVYRGGFEWYGLHVSVQKGRLAITEGRIGTHSHPLTISDNHVAGGWYIPPTEIELGDIAHVDILCRGTQAYVLLRSPDPAEQYPDDFTLLLSLAVFDGSTWYVTVPQRGDDDETNGY